jgi:hypothetical protein
VRYLRATFPIPERRACGLIGVGRSTVRYQGRARDEGALRKRLCELAAERRRFGYRRLPGASFVVRGSWSITSASCGCIVRGNAVRAVCAKVYAIDPHEGEVT